MRVSTDRPLPKPHLSTLEDGTGVIRTRYKGIEYTADLKDGCILYDGKSFKTPSGFSTYVRGKSTNGWTCVFYKGTKLSLLSPNSRRNKPKPSLSSLEDGTGLIRTRYKGVEYTADLKDGCIVTVMEGFAADMFTHCIRPSDTPVESISIIFRKII